MLKDQIMLLEYAREPSAALLIGYSSDQALQLGCIQGLITADRIH